MKQGRLLSTTLLFLLSLSLCIMCGCSSDSSSTGGSGGGDNGGGTVATLSILEVTATPASINPNETSSIEATAYDAIGNTIAGVDIVFTIDNPVLAFVTGTAKTDNEGVAEVFLTARDKTGIVNVSATAITGDATVTSYTPATVTIQEGAFPDRILLTVTPASIVAEGTATVEAQVLDANGNAVADGTSVSFTSNNNNYGSFTASTATTTNGYATATFKAANVQGTATVTAECVGISAQANLTIYPAQTATIEFVSATPQRIALQGTGTVGFPDYSILQYVVKDINGNPVNGEPVSFVLSGPSGGEYIDATPGDPTPEAIEGSTDAQGIVEVVLHSGLVAGPVTILGSITVTGSQGQELVIKSQSSVVSIGGGVPSAKRFSVAAEVLNLPGLTENNVETNISAYLADRFGNYNVLVGTTVSFITEQGLAIDTSDVTVDENGIATAVVRTQRPIGSPTAAEDVFEDPWETELIDYIEETYGYLLSGNPRDGLCSVLVYVKGEEHFNDLNADGIYNQGEETFIDTEADPYLDYNDDGQWTDGSADPFEEYIDSDGNGIWDGKNGVWDADKNIFANFKILLTGPPALIASDTPSFTIEDGGSRVFKIIVCDENGNMLTPGSTVSIKADGGELLGATEMEYMNTNGLGPAEMVVKLSDDKPDDEDPPEPVNITVSVTWKGAYSTIEKDVIVASGTID